MKKLREDELIFHKIGTIVGAVLGVLLGLFITDQAEEYVLEEVEIDEPTTQN